MMWREKNTRQAIAVSLAIHVAFFFLLALLKVSLPLNVAELTEITFVSGSGSSKLIKSSVSASTDKFSEPIKKQEEKASEVVKLPPRKMLETEPPQLKVVDQTKKIPQEENKALPESGDADRRKEDTHAQQINPDLNEKEIAGSTDGMSDNEKIIPNHSQTTDGPGTAPYQIEGQAARRVVIFKVIPEYPENLQEQATIKISFTVLPNGQVGEMMPVIKSDAELERVTLDALRQWRFSPLPPYEPQLPEKGIITFRYLLR